jgi:hypothetical protein
MTWLVPLNEQKFAEAKIAEGNAAAGQGEPFV